MQSRLLKNILSVSGVLILVKALGFFKQMVIAGIFGANAETDLINLSYGFIGDIQYLLLLRKHRWTGMSLSFALILDLICCNIVLKPLVGRIRPFLVNTAVELLTAPPADASFPSGHTAASFAAVFALRASGSPLWKPAAVLASVIAFSRLYLYVHWPTDVLGGILVGAAAGWAGARLADVLRRRRERLGRRA